MSGYVLARGADLDLDSIYRSDRNGRGTLKNSAPRS